VSSAKPPVWRDPRYRALFFQAIALGGTLFLGWYLVGNTLDNMARQGIASGFDFFDTTAGFRITTSLIPFSEKSTIGWAFLAAFLNTLLVSAIGIFGATIIGFSVGIARLSSNWMVAKLAEAYVEVLRNIPLLLQIFFWYFAVLRSLPPPRNSVSFFDAFFLNNRGFQMPSPVFEAGFGVVFAAFLLGIAGIVAAIFLARVRQRNTGRTLPVAWISLALLLVPTFLAALFAGFPMSWETPSLRGFNFKGGMELIPEFVALVLALSLYTATFIAEIVRAGILSVDRGQVEAARALGLNKGAVLRLVVLPQAMKVIIPPLASQYMNLIKNSSLAAAIAYPDLVLVFAGTVLSKTGQAVEIIAVTMGVYLTLSLLVSLFMNWYNQRMAYGER
jgi:general L-amino acid transport system permease protein